jgi:hypothetical protein
MVELRKGYERLDQAYFDMARSAAMFSSIQLVWQLGTASPQLSAQLEMLSDWASHRIIDSAIDIMRMEDGTDLPF